jgi:hypothetical protein
MKFLSFRHLGLALLLVWVVSGCSGSYHDTMHEVQHAVQAGNYQLADELLTQEKDLAEGKDRLLYLLDKGLVASLNGQYRESNRVFEEAAFLIEELDYLSITGTVSEWIINESTQPYKGEDFERVMVHYYMALNYLMLGELEDALVECRRLNNVLLMLNDRYENKNVYKTDAFILYLSGLIYDAMGSVNDAFIDYRHAYDVYRSDYRDYYGTPVPSQLLENLLRTSSALGFQDSFDTYARQFQGGYWSTQEEYRESARLVVIWDNGLVPYKAQWIYREYLELGDDVEEGCYVKLAFPDFVRRIPSYNQATVMVKGMTRPLELAEDVSQIAIKNLEDRRLRTFAKAITRNVLKCAAEYELKEENEFLGWLFTLVTEVTEQADTRSWLLLPANIHITQLLVPPGVSDVELMFSNQFGQVVHSQKYSNMTFEKGKTTFLIQRTF